MIYSPGDYLWVIRWGFFLLTSILPYWPAPTRSDYKVTDGCPPEWTDERSAMSMLLKPQWLKLDSGLTERLTSSDATTLHMLISIWLWSEAKLLIQANMLARITFGFCEWYPCYADVERWPRAPPNIGLNLDVGNDISSDSMNLIQIRWNNLTKIHF